jgi:hypothetical protein
VSWQHTTSAPCRHAAELPTGRKATAQERHRGGANVMQHLGRYAGVLFLIGISASCGLIVGLAVASAPTR